MNHVESAKADEVIRLAQELIEIPSVKGDIQACAAAIDRATVDMPEAVSLEAFTGQNANGDIVPSLVLFNQPTRPDRFRLLLHGHLDVVAAQDRDMFTPKKANGRLYGRGSYDMKAAAAALICAFKETAPFVNYPLGLSLTTDEEVGGYQGALRQVKAGVSADFVLSGEPTELEIGNQHKGLLSLELTAKTPGGHSAYDGEGANALLQVMGVQLEAAKKYPPPNGDWRTTASPTITETSNKANNVVPADARGRLSIRYVPGDDPETIRDNIADIDQRVDVRWFSGSDAHFTAPENLDVIRLAEAIHHHTGSQAKLRPLPHSSDLVHWTAVGAAGVDFGPAGYGMHTSEEYVDLESLNRFSAIMRTFIRSLDR